MSLFHDGYIFPGDPPRVFYRGFILPATADGRVDLNSVMVQDLLRHGRLYLDRAETEAERLPPHPVEGVLR